MSDLTLSAAVGYYLDARLGEVADSTLAWYSRNLGDLVARLGEELAVAGITSADLRAYRADLLTQKERWASHPFKPTTNSGLSASTVHGRVRALKSFFAWLAVEGYLETSPAVRVGYPRLPALPPAEIEREDFLKLVETAAGGRRRDLAIVLFLGSTGCRVEGLANLKLDDINGRAAVVNEKGDKSRLVFFGRLCRQALDDYLATERPDAVGHSSLLVSVYRPHRPLSEHGIYQAINSLAERAGVVGRVNPHSFRHAAALNWLRLGSDVATVSQLLGHENIKTTTDSYVRWAAAELQSRHAQFDWVEEAMRER